MSHICGCATRTPSLRSSREMEQCQPVPQRSHTSPETAAPSAQAYSQRHQSSEWRRGDVVEPVPTLRAAPDAPLHHIVDRPGKESTVPAKSLWPPESAPGQPATWPFAGAVSGVTLIADRNQARRFVSKVSEADIWLSLARLSEE